MEKTPSRQFTTSSTSTENYLPSDVCGLGVQGGPSFNQETSPGSSRSHVNITFEVQGVDMKIVIIKFSHRYNFSNGLSGDGLWFVGVDPRFQVVPQKKSNGVKSRD